MREACLFPTESTKDSSINPAAFNTLSNHRRGFHLRDAAGLPGLVITKQRKVQKSEKNAPPPSTVTKKERALSQTLSHISVLSFRAMIPAKPEAVLPQRATDLQHLIRVPQPAHPARAPSGCHGCTACYLHQPRLLRQGRESETSPCWLCTANKCASHASVKSEHAVSAKITGSYAWRSLQEGRTRC